MYDVRVKSRLPELYKELDDIIQGGRLTGKNIYVFGKGICGFAVTQYLHSKGIDPCCVLDNNTSEPDWRNTVRLSVLSDPDLKVKFSLPEDALKKFDDNAVILIGSNHYASQSAQVMKMGYTEEKHIIEVDKAKVTADGPVFGKKLDLDSDGIKSYLFDLLKFLKKICSENGLTFYLTEGTLLGAVRHKGFIPWDDDIDVSMPIKDYLKLHEIFRNNNYEFGKYSLYSMVDDKKCMYAYAKLMNTDTRLFLKKFPMNVMTHISIDIFPLSGVPYHEKNEYDRFLSDLKAFNSDWMKYRSYIGMDTYPFDDCKNKWKELLTRYDYDNSSGISYIFAEDPNYRVCDRELYDHVEYIEFEGEMFPVLSGYKEYLEMAYGDYMTPPANWQRFGKHFYSDCWIKDDIEK